MTIFAGIAEFERDLIRERTGAGRADAHKRGVRFGRPKKMNEDQRKLAQRLLKEGKSVREVARTFSVHPATLYRILAPAVSIFCALIAVATATLASNCGAQDFSASARKADFKSFVQNFEGSYAYLDRPEKPWLTWDLRYEAAIKQAQSKEIFDTVLASALSELHDFHAEVRSSVPNRWLPVPTFTDIWAEFQGPRAVVIAVRQGSDAARAGVEVGDTISAVGSVPLERAIADRLTPAVDQTDPRARQWAVLSVLTGRSDEARTFTVVRPNGRAHTITLPVERHFDRPAGALKATTLPGNIGLIRFNNSLGEQRTVAAFDQALSELRGTKGLILDLRMCQAEAIVRSHLESWAVS